MLITPRSSHVAKQQDDKSQASTFIGVSSHSSDSIVFEDSHCCESLSGSFDINPQSPDHSENRIGTEPMKVTSKNDDAWFTLSTYSISDLSALQSQDKMTKKEREARARERDLLRKLQNSNYNKAQNSLVDAVSTRAPLQKQNTDYGIGWQPRKPIFAPYVRNDAKIDDNRVSKIPPMKSTKLREPIFVPSVRNDAKTDGSRVSTIPRLTSSEITVRKMAEKWEQKIQDMTTSRHSRSNHSPKLGLFLERQQSLETPVSPKAEIADLTASPEIASQSQRIEDYSEFEGVTEEINKKDESRALDGWIQAISTNSESPSNASSHTEYESETEVHFESDIEETEFSEDETEYESEYESEYEDVTETNEEEGQQISEEQGKNLRRIPIEIEIQMKDDSTSNESVYTETKSFAEVESEDESDLYIVIPQAFHGAKTPKRESRRRGRRPHEGKSQKLMKRDGFPPRKQENHKRDDKSKKPNKKKRENHKRENRIRDNTSKEPNTKKRENLPTKKWENHKRENRIRDDKSKEANKKKRENHKRENRIRADKSQKLTKSDVLLQRQNFLPARPPRQTLKKSDYLPRQPTMQQMVSPPPSMAPDLETGILCDDDEEESINASDIHAVAIWRSEQLAEDARREAKKIKLRMIAISIILVVGFVLIFFVVIDPRRRWL